MGDARCRLVEGSTEYFEIVDYTTATDVLRHIKGAITASSPTQTNTSQSTHDIPSTRSFSFLVGTGDERRVRTTGTPDRPLFCVKDICDFLGIKNSRDKIAILPSDDKGVELIDTLGGIQRMTFCTEAGMYRIAMTCRDANKKGTIPFRFVQWISKDVLPSIRRTGAYAAAPPSPPPSQPLCRTDTASRRMLLETDIENERLEGRRAEMILSNAPRIREADRALKARAEERTAIARLRCEEAKMAVATERARREAARLRRERLDDGDTANATDASTAATTDAADADENRPWPSVLSYAQEHKERYIREMRAIDIYDAVHVVEQFLANPAERAAVGREMSTNQKASKSLGIPGTIRVSSGASWSRCANNITHVNTYQPRAEIFLDTAIRNRLLDIAHRFKEGAEAKAKAKRRKDANSRVAISRSGGGGGNRTTTQARPAVECRRHRQMQLAFSANATAATDEKKNGASDA